MEINEFKELLYLVAHFSIIAALLRAFFYLWLAKRILKTKSFLVRAVPLLVGLFGLTMQTSNSEILASRFPEVWLLFMSLSHLAYVNARDIARETQSISILLKHKIDICEVDLVKDSKEKTSQIIRVQNGEVKQVYNGIDYKIGDLIIKKDV